MGKRNSLLAITFSLLLVAMSTTASATPLGGTLDIGGFTMQVGATSINFGSGGSFLVLGGTGDFAALPSSTGTIKNLVSQPINQPFSLPSFLVFAADPNIRFDLTLISPGIDPAAACAVAPAPGQTCTPVVPALVSPANPLGLSPFNFQNTQNGSTLSFTVSGTATSIATGETSQFSAIFTSQYNVFYQTLLSQIASNGSTTFNSTSATFNVTFTPITQTPEPSSLFLCAFGLVGAAGMLRRRLLR